MSSEVWVLKSTYYQYLYWTYHPNPKGQWVFKPGAAKFTTKQKESMEIPENAKWERW